MQLKGIAVLLTYQILTSITNKLQAFVHHGVIPSWESYPRATMDIGNEGAVQPIARDYHGRACGFWESHGFFNYSWAGN